MISSLYAYKALWSLVAVIGTGGLLVLLNLWFLTRNKNTRFHGHALILIFFLTISSANYLVRGIGPSYSYWFYIIPLLAAVSLVEWRSVILYSTLAFLMILGFSIFSIPPYYHLPPHLLFIIDWTNHVFAYLIIATIITHLLLEDKRYKKILHDKNYLLALEKEKFQYLAHYDQLTNLPNREHFKQKLQALIDSLSENQSATVFFMDLDDLKYVNDNYGHEVGDQLLMQSAKRLKSCFGEDDFVSRLGGDEFTAIVVHAKGDDVPRLIAKRIIQEFEKPFILGGIEHRCSISIGLSNYPYDSQTIKQLLIKADLAMYAAKKVKGSSYI